MSSGELLTNPVERLEAIVDLLDALPDDKLDDELRRDLEAARDDVLVLAHQLVSGGAWEILLERARQIDPVHGEGWSSGHDDEHTEGELRDAGIAYAMFCNDDGAGECAVDVWPWHESWWKPNDDATVNLRRAGALFAAEIDRLKRRRARDESAAKKE